MAKPSRDHGPPLDPGDRLPDFFALRADGTATAFFDLIAGAPCVLIIGGGVLPATPDGWQRARLITGDGALPDDDGALALRDPEGRIAQALLGPQPKRNAFCLDATGRIRARVPAARLARAITDLPDPLTAADVPPPLLIVPEVLSAAECRRFIAHFDASPASASGMARTRDGQTLLEEDRAVKSRLDLQLTDRALSELLGNRLFKRVLPEIGRVFQYQVTRYERPKLVRYDAEAGGHFAAHRDNTTPDAAHRRFALTLNLNQGAYQGGGVTFPEFSQQPVQPPSGAALVFSCALLHRVTPVTSGNRYAIISFFYGEREALAKRST
jgi:predicted 2-oxoglutarate/Fe(II)-dependent dioxygenase YbiX